MRLVLSDHELVHALDVLGSILPYEIRAEIDEMLSNWRRENEEVERICDKFLYSLDLDIMADILIDPEKLTWVTE
jgi:hypothetical protein